MGTGALQMEGRLGEFRERGEIGRRTMLCVPLILPGYKTNSKTGSEIKADSKFKIKTNTILLGDFRERGKLGQRIMLCVPLNYIYVLTLAFWQFSFFGSIIYVFL